ncbi:hypothetical protein CK203_001667 [Vitis vinifera]|uniref:DUF4283 domain-containing protein n=1 Tax=Vitis vinifera TaxID=29760 RepID=A0A438KKV0_VITVI|nr:hypothetical protein CK203_001667 [Vitis vinifera]
MSEDSRGGKSWFAMEFKSFELQVEVIGGKLKECTWERCRGTTSWIRFGEVSLSRLLDSVEACCRDNGNRRWVLDWEKGGGNIGWSVVSGLKKFNGSSWGERFVVKDICENGKTETKRIGDSVWLELEERELLGRKDQLDRCSVGWWGADSVHVPDLNLLKGFWLEGKEDSRRMFCILQDGIRRWGVSDKALALRRLSGWGYSFLHEVTMGEDFSEVGRQGASQFVGDSGRIRLFFCLVMVGNPSLFCPGGVGPSKGGLGFDGPVKASTLPIVDFKAKAQDESQIEVDGGRRSTSSIFEGDPLLAVAPLSPSEVARAEFINEALMERPPGTTLFLAGGLVAVEDESSLDPLSIVLVDEVSGSRKANDSNKMKVIKALIRDQKVNLVCLQETKIQEISIGVVCSLGVGRNCENGFVWESTGVYGPISKKYRESFWKELGLSVDCGMTPGALEGILMCQEGPFTWNGGLNRQTMSRLDRFLVSEDWESRFSGVVQSTLPRPVSDYYPILLDGEGGSSSCILATKLKALKGILKTWNKEVFGKVEVNKRLALQQINFWDTQERSRALSMEEREARKEVKD